MHRHQCSLSITIRNWSVIDKKREKKEEPISKEFIVFAKNAKYFRIASLPLVPPCSPLRRRRSTVLLAKGHSARPRNHGFG